MAAVFLFSKEKTGDTTKAALAAAGAGALAYYTVEPTNANSIWGDAVSDTLGISNGAPDRAITNGVSVPGSGTTTPTNVYANTNPGTNGIGGVLSSWGAAGTAGVIAATGAATGSGIFSGNNNNKWLWIGAGVLALVLLTDGD